MFRGGTGLSIFEWVEEVQACISGCPLSLAEKELFIYDHLEGKVREEIKYRPQEEKEDPENFLSVLEELHGCRVMCLCRRSYFQEDNKRGKVVKKAPNGPLNKDVLLRDQFVGHVFD